MLIVLLVAGIAIGGRALIEAILMAILTGNFSMLAFQFESR